MLFSSSRLKTQWQKLKDLTRRSKKQKVLNSVFKPLRPSGFTLSSRSNQSLHGVDPSLVRVVKRAIQITEQDFVVIEGLRTLSRQKQLVAKGFSKTLNSKHIVGRAVDIIPHPVPGDWDQYTIEQWAMIAKAMKVAAAEQGVALEWGYDIWKWDKPHYQLKD